MQPVSSSNTAACSRSSASTEEGGAAANNSPRRKRRRMATGHGVQQISETSTVLLPPQQQEQPTLPPIEHRHVAEHQSAATASFAGAEPTETHHSEPAAAFEETPAAHDPMAIEAGPAAEEIPPLEDIIANFLPYHQEEIRERLNDEDVQQILNAVKNFLTLLRERGLKLSPGRGRIPTPSLFGRLWRLSVTNDAETIRKFFEKATLFFSAVNTAQIKNTGCLSTMLDSNTHIANFANETEDNLRLLAGNPYLKQITSMCSRKGVPDPVKAGEIIEWDCWKIGDTFCVELLRAFSSMMNGRGLINDQAQVVEMLAWECWQPDGEFSMELLRAVSSMMSRRGFPDKDTLTAMLIWDCWKVDGKFSIELLRIFSSMMSGWGIPQKENVEAILAWPCWQVNGNFSFALLRTFSSMSSGRGLIKQAEVERVLAWPCWQVNGKFSLDLLRIFSSMASRCGLLKDEVRITAILAWECWKTEGEFSIELLRTVTLMLSGRGLPEKESIEKLLSWPCWQVDGKFNMTGLRFWLKYYSDNPDRKQSLTRALLLSAPLAHTKYALTQLLESEWSEYLELCKNLTPTPNKEQWQALKPFRDLLHRRFTLTLKKRMMLEILWPQSEDNRLRYAEKLDTLFNTVSTIGQLYRLHQVFKPQKLQAFLDACLARENTARQSINETVPKIKTQETLLEGLLLINHYLSKHEQIPDLCFSRQLAGANGSGVIVDGDAEMSGHQRLWHFIAALLIELNQTEYQFKQQQLRISPPDSETIILPKPEFTGTSTGFVITNWSLEQLTAFFRATEFTEHWYKNPDDTRDICVIRRKQRLLQMRERPQNTTQTGYKSRHDSSHSLLSPSMIINLIKQGIRLKPAVWSSLEHYVKNGQLSNTLCRLLAPIIKKELASTAPDSSGSHRGSAPLVNKYICRYIFTLCVATYESFANATCDSGRCY